VMISEEVFIGGEKKGTVQIFFDETTEQCNPTDIKRYENFKRLKEFSMRLGEILSNIMQREEGQKLQRQLFIASKMASIGELSAGVGHEINNPLSIIYGYLEILGDRYKKDHPDISDLLDKVDKALFRIKKIVDGLRSFARSDMERMEYLSIHKTISKSLCLIEALYLQDGITISTHFNAEELYTRGNSGKFQQVLMNLFSNAKDAIKEANANQEKQKHGGTISISTLKGEDQHHCIIKISDNGVGMPKEVQERIFDPFFTTKPLGEGTGLGLGISLAIIKEMHGDVSVHSLEGVGTTFTIEVPEIYARADATILQEQHTHNKSITKEITGHVLIVDDEMEIREILKPQLRSIGLIVEEAENGEIALEKIKKQAFNFIITDLKMPTMGGDELIKKLKAFGRREKIIVIAGGMQVEQALDSKLVDGVLRKPFTFKELYKTISQCCEACPY
ncbi:MAG: response regulator, partial [Oligoflexia bacterium]|nr:response regulator [Oligoflexia bacterium]